MEEKLKTLVERIGKDINGMPWLDRGITPAQLKNSVEFFIRTFQSDILEVIEEENAKEAKKREATS